MSVFWKDVTKVERIRLADTVKKPDSSCNVLCVKEINAVCHIPFKDMHNVRSIMQRTVDNPRLIDVGGKGVSEKPTPKPDNAEVQEVEDTIKSANDGLPHFKLKPDSLKDKALFNHTVKFRGEHVGVTDPSVYLGVEVSALQKSIIAPTNSELSHNKVIQEIIGLGAPLK